MADRSIRLILRAEVSGFKKAMDDAAASTKKVGKGAGDSSKQADTALGRMVQSASRNQQAWQGVGRTLMVAGGAVTAFGAAALTAGINYNTLQQTSRAALTSLLGSAQAANAQMDKLDEFATTSPFAKQTFISAQQQMLAFGIETQKVIPYLDAVQNAVAAAGGSNDDIAGLVATMSKIQSSSKLTAQDLNEFGNRGVNAAELIGSQMGMTGAEIREAITSGTLDATQALDMLVAGMSEKFDGAADNVKNTFAGAMDRVKAAWRDFASELATPLVNPEGGGALVNLLNFAADAMRAFGNLPAPIKNTISGLAGIGGVAALAAGGLITIIPKAIELYGSFKKLGESHPKVVSGLGAVGKAAGLTAIAFTAASVAGALLDRDIKGVSATQLESQLRGVSDAADLAAIGFNGMDDSFVGLIKGTEITRDLEGAFKRIADPSPWQSFDDWSAKVFGARTTDAERMTGQFGQLGEALANIYASDPEQAASLFNQMLIITGASTDELLALMPAYADALAETENAQATAAESAGQLSGLQGKIARGLASTDEAAQASAKALQKWAESTTEAYTSFVSTSDAYQSAIDKQKEAAEKAADSSKSAKDSWEDFYDGASVSVSQFIEQLKEQVTAQQNWADNIIELSDRVNSNFSGAARDAGNAWVDELVAMGPEGAAAVQALAGASDKELKQIVGLYGKKGDESGAAFAETLDNHRARVNVDADTDKAEKKTDSVITQISKQQARIVVDANPSLARKTGEDAEKYISRLTAQMQIDGNEIPARRSGENAESYIKRLIAQMTIDADPSLAKKKGESAKEYADRLKGVIDIDADQSLARKKGESLQAWAKRLDGMVKISGDTTLARKKGESVQNWAKRLEGVVKIDGDDEDARTEVKDFETWARLRSAVIKIKGIVQRTFSDIGGTGDGEGAGWKGSTPRGVSQMSAAVRRIDPSTRISSGYRPGARTATGFPSYHGMGRAIDIVSPNMGRTWDLLRQQFGSRAKELYYTPRGFIRNGSMTNAVSPVTRATHYSHVHLALAGGGPARGPGGPTSDKIPAWLSNGEHVLTAADVRKLGGQDAVYRLREAIQAGRFNLDPEATFAKGGAVGSASRALRSARGKASRLADQLRRARKAAAAAEKAERRAGKTKSKSDDKSTRRRSNRADKKVTRLEKQLRAARDAASKQQQRVSRLREQSRDTRTDLRRGDIRESVTGGLSSAYGVVDQMVELARSGDLTKRQARRLSKNAGVNETKLRKLYRQAEALDKRLEKAQERVENLKSIRDDVKSSLMGGFSLDEVVNAWTGKPGGTKKEYLAAAKKYASQAKAFAGKLQQLQKKGFSGVILQEIAGMGVEGGTAAADALLGMSKTEVSQMNTAYKSIASWSNKAGQYVTQGFYKGGLSAAQGVVKGLEKNQKKIEKQILRIAKSMERALKKALGIKSPSAVFRELGAQTAEGMRLGLVDGAGGVARASEALARIPSVASPGGYANPPKGAVQQVTAVVDKGAMAEAMNGMRLTLVADGKPITAIAQTVVDTTLTTGARTMVGGRR